MPARLAVNASAKSREARLPSEPPSLSLRDFNSFKTGVAKSNVVLMMRDDIFKSIRCQTLGIGKDGGRTEQDRGQDGGQAICHVQMKPDGHRWVNGREWQGQALLAALG